MLNTTATETQEDSLAFALVNYCSCLLLLKFTLVNYCSHLLLLKCSDAEGQQQQETSSTDKPHTNSDSLIGEIRESLHCHYSELHLQDSSKDE